MSPHPLATPIYSAIGGKVREARTQARLTQAGLAAALGRGRAVTRTTINNLEKGRQFVPLPVLYDIAGVFHLEIADLLPSREHAEAMLNQSAINGGSRDSGPTPAKIQDALIRLQTSVTAPGGNNARS